MKKALELFKTFFIIGAFTIGGGYAMLPLFEEEFIHKKKWFTDEDYMNMITIATSAPGPLAVNCAVYTGYHIDGLKGSIASVLGVITPPIAIILMIVPAYQRFNEIEIVGKIFLGVRPAVLGLIIAAIYKMIKRSDLRGIRKIVPIIAFIIIILLDVDPAFVVLGLGLVGFGYGKYQRRYKS